MLYSNYVYQWDKNKMRFSDNFFYVIGTFDVRTVRKIIYLHLKSTANKYTYENAATTNFEP